MTNVFDGKAEKFQRLLTARLYLHYVNIMQQPKIYPKHLQVQKEVLDTHLGRSNLPGL
jgi:hypothetical protein